MNLREKFNFSFHTSSLGNCCVKLGMKVRLSKLRKLSNTFSERCSSRGFLKLFNRLTTTSDTDTSNATDADLFLKLSFLFITQPLLSHLCVTGYLKIFVIPIFKRFLPLSMTAGFHPCFESDLSEKLLSLGIVRQRL